MLDIAIEESGTANPANPANLQNGIPIPPLRAGVSFVRLSAMACLPNPDLGLPRRSAAKPGTCNPKILVKSMDSDKPFADGSSGYHIRRAYEQNLLRK